MFNSKKINIHFDSKAETYQKRSHSFPWSIIRKKESDTILSMMGNIKNKTILDVGCGSGYYSKLLIKKNAKKVYAIDRSNKMLKKIREKNIIKVNQNVENFNINNTFEKVVCAGILEFVNSVEKVLKNIKKHSKNNCILVILCPTDNFLAKLYKIYHACNGIKINLFETNKIKKVINNSGWQIKKIKKVFFSNIIVAILKK
tara:strand:- start:187 stop:789 length:603 start_codon:yes stop_codon:yes gene_type:complete